MAKKLLIIAQNNSDLHKSAIYLKYISNKGMGNTSSVNFINAIVKCLIPTEIVLIPEPDFDVLAQESNSLQEDIPLFPDRSANTNFNVFGFTDPWIEPSKRASHHSRGGLNPV